MSDETIPPGDEPEDPPETLCERCMISFRTWPDEASARHLGDYVLGYTRALSRHYDLSRLEAVVVGMDYHEAIRSVDRNNEAQHAVPTSNEYGQGGAMTLPVVRDDELWSVVVLWGALAAPLADEGHELHRSALYTLAHEFAHADDQRLFVRTFPGGWRAAREPDARESALWEMVKPCQSEYTASRRSAWAFHELGLDYLGMLGAALTDVDAQIRAARYAYRRHGDVDQFWTLVQTRLGFLFQALGYALGHADWIASPNDLPPELIAQYDAKLDELRRLPSGWVVDAAREAVQPFHRLEAYTGLDLYDGLKAVAERLLHQYGIFPSTNGDRVHLNIPRHSPWYDLSTRARGRTPTRRFPAAGTR